jgi:2-phospho-L-lactate guanylyltransferase
MRTLAVLPVKSFAQAKQRLRPELDPYRRRALVEAMLRDVLDALNATRLDGVIVITPADAPREIACERGAQVLRDREQGHNAAAQMGIEAALREGADRVLLVPGDCPGLDPAELDRMLMRRAARREVVIVPDRHGTGTNALLLAPPDVLEPSFGPGSCQRHAERAQKAGVAHEILPLASLALDIDTPEDLAVLAGLGNRAAATNALLARC